MMKLAIPTLSLLLIVPACGHDRDNDRDKPIVEVEVDQSQFEKERKELVEKTEKRIRSIEMEAARLREKLPDLEGASKRNAERALTTLEERRRELADQVALANDQSREQWREFKEELSQFAQDLEDAYNAALEQLKTNN